MIPYDLAVRLRDSGFPQREFPGSMICKHNLLADSPIYIDESLHYCEEGVYAPTLSELIVELGDSLQSLINNKPNGWIGFTNRKDERGERLEIKGPTPEIAVSELWLKIKGNICEHNWIDARNEVVESGEYCSRCGAINK